MEKSEGDVLVDEVADSFWGNRMEDDTEGVCEDTVDCDAEGLCKVVLVSTTELMTSDLGGSGSGGTAGAPDVLGDKEVFGDSGGAAEVFGDKGAVAEFFGDNGGEDVG